MIFSIFLFISFLPDIAVASCPISVCNSSNPRPDIRFPFRLSNQSPSCGFPGFDLSCDSQKQTIITLPSSGDFSVDFIDYWEQTLFINDLDKCLTKRFFENDFSLAGSHFSLPFDALDHFTFLKCSSNKTVPKDNPPVNCLGDDYVSYMVIAVSTSTVMPPDYYGCSVISTAVVAPKYLDVGVKLAWNEPDCSYCESNGLLCELENVKTSKIWCSSQTGALSTAAKIGIVLGVGIPVVLFILCFCDWSSGEPTITELSTIATGQMQLPVAERALDRRTIEAYPKIQLGESLELLPEPDNKTCPICLCDYQAKEILRTVPECNHYFHADCIDTWLRKNPTCPLCRNLPKSSVTDEKLCYSVMHATCPHSCNQSPTPTSQSSIYP
ncbi:PREDICTED: putative RING-H2 finger protein ATL21B [Fragaria vesca subsp. vesca]|uniref:putative RING-H2 finger protein ATL21B n=1 Tax=Fragaria vesca subsp. vesca TaxID=101020 RepID=UPI0002C317B6|nr:PREDICTED: putative RING-H2 finger protein ATL21B [Fragaria vesca subsp. vesca]